jgi:hypothetical protein
MSASARPQAGDSGGRPPPCGRLEGAVSPVVGGRAEDAVGGEPLPRTADAAVRLLDGTESQYRLL